MNRAAVNAAQPVTEQEPSPIEDAGTQAFGVAVDQLLGDIALRFEDRPEAQVQTFTLQEAKGAAPFGEPMSPKMHGLLREEPTHCPLPPALKEFLAMAHTRVDLQIDIAGTCIEFGGFTDRLGRNLRTELELAVRGDRLDSLNRLRDVDLPPLQNYSLDAGVVARPAPAKPPKPLSPEALQRLNARLSLSVKGVLSGSDNFGGSEFKAALQDGLVDLWAVNLLASVVDSSVKGDDALQVNCLLSRWSVENGRMKAQQLAVDTFRIRICADGLDTGSRTGRLVQFAEFHRQGSLYPEDALPGRVSTGRGQVLKRDSLCTADSELEFTIQDLNLKSGNHN